MQNYSKSLPPNEFHIYVSSADSGIDSDHSPNSSIKLANSIEDIEPSEKINISPESFLKSKEASETERIDGINKSLNWMKEELTKMKSQDRELTKKMITIRSEIAECKVAFEKRDNGYDSDTDNLGPSTGDEYIKENWKLIAKDGAFPTSGVHFENNKRATWAV